MPSLHVTITHRMRYRIIWKRAQWWCEAAAAAAGGGEAHISRVLITAVGNHSNHNTNSNSNNSNHNSNYNNSRYASLTVYFWCRVMISLHSSNPW